MAICLDWILKSKIKRKHFDEMDILKKRKKKLRYKKSRKHLQQ